jgi:hypothetical protein
MIIYNNLMYYLRFRRFQQGNLSLEDRHRSGRPSTIDTQRLKAFIEGWFIIYIISNPLIYS